MTITGTIKRILRILSIALATALSSMSHAAEYTNVTVAAGVNYTQWTPLPGDTDLIHHMTGGAAASDFDNDGWVDLYVTRLNETDILYRNMGNGTFQDVSASAGFTQSLFSNGATWGDVDNDGDKDLYVTTNLDASFRNHLYINNGDGTFDEQGIARGAALPTSSLPKGFGSTFGDYDNDGYLDLFTSEWNAAPGTGNSRLLRNLGAANPGVFEDVTLPAGVDVSVGHPASIAYAFSPTFADMDNDGHTDLVIAGDFGGSRLFWNNGDGTFSNGTVPAGVGTDENGMGSALGDYDNDGDLDWFVSSIYEEGGACGGQSCGWGDTGNRLFRNNGNRTFEDVTDATGVREGGWGWGSEFVDYDNDGDLDLAQTNGVDFPPVSSDAPFVDDPTRFWRNDGGTFTEVAIQTGITDIDSGKGLLKFDYDNDGDQDLFIVNNAGQPILYRNDGGNDGDWLRIKANGSGSNADGVGAQITVLLDADQPDNELYWEIKAGNNYLGQSDITAHFGLGDFPDNIDRITVEWPATGIVQVIGDVSPNQLLEIFEPLAGLGGDFNNDGFVDAADFTVWRDNMNSPDELSLNGNGDGLNGVDVGDFLLWRANFGSIAGAGAATVPEPNGLIWAFLCMALATKRRLSQRIH